MLEALGLRDVTDICSQYTRMRIMILAAYHDNGGLGLRIQDGLGFRMSQSTAGLSKLYIIFGFLCMD